METVRLGKKGQMSIPKDILKRLSRLASGHRLPDKDIPIFAAAIAASATVLVTGDRRNFGSLYGKKVAGVTVVAPAQAVTLGLS